MPLTNEIVLREAGKLGFDLTGFAPAEILEEETGYLEEWLSENRHAGMQYMAANTDKRKDVKLILPDAESVISLALIYNTPVEHEHKSGTGKISRYAWGTDYHYIIWDKLARLEETLKQYDPGFNSKSYVDTGPVMDKVWAVRAGLGWMGKHTNVINRKKGSWFFIATLITNREFDYNPMPEFDYCGSCTKCMDACPTNALEPYKIDAGKCISYLTIENKEDIPEEFSGKFENWIFGCDICQEVCPWNNKFGETTKAKHFYPENSTVIPFDKFDDMTGGEFRREYKASPISRARLKGMRRNALFLKNNS